VGLRWFAWIACTALVVACGDDGGAEPEPDSTTAPVEEVTVDPDALIIHGVLRVEDPCHTVTLGEDEQVVTFDDDPESPCYVVGPLGVDATMVEQAELASDGGEVAVAVDLDDEGTAALNALATAAFPEQGSLAILVDGRLVYIAPVAEPEFAGSVAVSGLTEDEAIALVTALGGDPTLPEPG
jgi:hypothetical protein